VSTPSVCALLRALPKVELHVHLVGSASVPTVLALAARHGAATVPTDPRELAEFYAFRDFAHFVDVYRAVNALVTTAADVTELVRGLARDLAAGGVRHAEVTVTPLNHLTSGIEPGRLADALIAGRDQARAEHGVGLNWIFDTATELGVDAAWATLDWVRRHRPEGTVGFGLAGMEVGFARAPFARPFAEARDLGLRSLPHAGETSGPDTVWSAVRDLGAERIGHGISAVDDPRLVDQLAERGIPLDVCPTSNLRTGAVRSPAEHPLPRLVRAGVPVTINTDDPGMFGCDIVGEYRMAHDVLGLSVPELVQIARTAMHAATLPAQTKNALLADIDAAVRPVPDG
jgi:aminodeoxyfutalosine deaminase